MSQAELQKFVDGVCEACERGEESITPPHSSIVGSMSVHYRSGMICTKAIPRDKREILAKMKGWKSDVT